MFRLADVLEAHRIEIVNLTGHDEYKWKIYAKCTCGWDPGTWHDPTPDLARAEAAVRADGWRHVEQELAKATPDDQITAVLDSLDWASTVEELRETGETSTEAEWVVEQYRREAANIVSSLRPLLRNEILDQVSDWLDSKSPDPYEDPAAGLSQASKELRYHYDIRGEIFGTPEMERMSICDRVAWALDKQADRPDEPNTTELRRAAELVRWMETRI